MLKFFPTLLTAFSISYAELLFPENGQELNYIYVLFEWDQEPDAVSYNLQVSNSESFNNVILDINEETTFYIEKDTLEWENTCYWRVRPIHGDNSYGEWSEISYFSIGVPFTENLIIDIYNNDQIQDGLIMFGWPVKVIDKYGNEIWNAQSLYLNHINDHGKLYGNYLNGRAGEHNYLSNEYLWITSEESTIDIHEIKQISNGNYVAFTPTYQLGPVPLGDWTQTYQNLGYVADGVTNEFHWQGLKIVEFERETKEEVWSWDPFEHFSMDDHDLYGGTWWDATNSWSYDWMHSNAFHFDEEESVFYVSHRHLSRISKIAYPSGEVIWNMGLPAEYNTGDDNICTDLLFSFQHNIQLLDDGDLLFFDNGNLSQMLLGDPNPISRIRRIRVIDDSYCETIWQYDLLPDLYGRMDGSVQLLSNGNYLIHTHGYDENMEGSGPSIIEVKPDSEIVWKVNGEYPPGWHRAYMIPSIHPIAFSVLLDQYSKVDVDGDSFIGIVLDDANSSLSFTIYNQSGYSQPYTYTLSDNNGWFNVSSDTVTIEDNEHFIVTLEPMVDPDSVTSLTIDIWPIYHEYAMKSMNYDVYRVDGVLSEMEKNIPTEYALFHNYPNPFNPTTQIRYDLPENAMVNITIYDMMGRQIKTLVNGSQTAGYKSIQWNAINDEGKPVSAGLYLYTIEAGKFRQTKKMVLLK